MFIGQFWKPAAIGSITSWQTAQPGLSITVTLNCPSSQAGPRQQRDVCRRKPFHRFADAMAVAIGWRGWEAVKVCVLC